MINIFGYLSVYVKIIALIEYTFIIKTFPEIILPVEVLCWQWPRTVVSLMQPSSLFLLFRLVVVQIDSIVEYTDETLQPTVFSEPLGNTLLLKDSNSDDPTGDLNKLSSSRLQDGTKVLNRKISDQGCTVCKLD